MKKLLFVCGNWGDESRPSSYATKLASGFASFGQFTGDGQLNMEFRNGGTFHELESLVSRMREFDIVLWFANVPNTHEKIVKDIKTVNPEIMLVTSKNNLDGKYGLHEIVARTLAAKANLCLVFEREGGVPDGKFVGTIIDPLGNCFGNKIVEPIDIVRALHVRLFFLMSMRRMGSRKIGEAIPVPEKTEFFEYARECANTFHDLIHHANTDRFLGNLSFRCETGFPSFRQESLIFVSRRNIDKRMIGAEGFVAVDTDYNVIPISKCIRSKDSVAVGYFGDNKPSVDTPVQVALYNAYPKVNFMMHSHVYVENPTATTDGFIPCGAMNEVESIVRLSGKLGSKENFTVNLPGHGSIVFASSVYYMKTVKFVSRPFPEMFDE